MNRKSPDGLSASEPENAEFLMKCLITGAGGFIGSHLVEFLLTQKQAVVAVAHRPAIFLSALESQIEIEYGDLLDEKFIADTLARHNPDIVFHLAAQSLPQTAWQEPALTFRVNLIGSLKLFDIALRQTRPPLIIVASSSSIYVPSRKSSLLNEEAPLRPDSIYAASKLAMEQLAGLYGGTKGLKIICVRPFFIIGPRKEGDVSSDFARGIVGIERGEAIEMRVGNLTNIRDFLDVRDGVSALWQIALQGKTSAIYNICSGKGCSTGDLLALFKKNARLAVREIIDPDRMRPIDDQIKIGDPAKLMALGWEPRVDLETSVKAILDYWRGID